MSLTAADYRQDPGRAAATAWWKVASGALPEDVAVVHRDDDRTTPGLLPERYFKLVHRLSELPTGTLPPGFQLVDIAADAWTDGIVATINPSYPDVRVTANEVRGWRERPVYAPELWLGVVASDNHTLLASAIAELDRTIGEASLEWVQVLPQFQGRGIGRALVTALLARARSMADFATVSGQLDSDARPDRLYRACGFTGNDVWHVYREATHA